LAALLDSPDAFGTIFADANEWSDAVWQHQAATLPTFIAVDDGSDGSRDVGMVRADRDTEDPSTAWLISMWVDPFVRRHGVGRALIDAVTAWARTSKLRRLALDVADSNLAAVALYERMGFRASGETGSLPPPRTHITEHRSVLTL
jgi:ribosomal protein S18 acetylase RimI-like enzyme